MQENKQEKSPIKQNILLYLAKKGISPYEFYKISGVTRGILSQNNGISEENIARFLQFAPDVSPSWLLTGRGEMLLDKQDFSTSQENRVKTSKQRQKNDLNTAPSARTLQKADAPGEGIPLIPLEVAAGFPLIDEAGIALEDCDRYIVPEFQNKGAQFLIRVSGNSMYPRYASGDILACRKIEEIRFIQWGKVYVIDSSQGQLVKMIFEDKSPEYILCVSENGKDFPPFQLPKDDIRSLSTVIGCIKLE